MAAFPAYAKLMLQGFSHTPRPGIVRTEMESGPPKQATKESRILHSLPVVYLLTSKADYLSFLTWWETTINRIDWFDWTDPVDATVRQARLVGGAIEFRPRTGTLVSWEASFELEYWGS